MKKILQSVGNWLQSVFEEQKHDRQKNTIAALDGVRACAILMVIAFHIDWGGGSVKNFEKLWDWRTNPLASSVAIAGGAGVTLFFVLSGFLLFLPYAKALLSGGRWPLARTFYVRRALRIMPGYYLSLFLLILLTAPQYFHPLNLSGLGHVSFLGFLMNDPRQPPNVADLGLFMTFLMDSSAQTFRRLNGPYWTLAIEWQFYMILPLLTLGILLLVGRVRIERRLRAVTLCLFCIIAAGLAVRLLGEYFQSNPTATFLVSRPALNVILFFVYGQTSKYTEDFAVGMLGALIYMYAQSLPQDHRFVRGLRRLSLWLWAAGMVILVFSAMWHFQSPQTPAWPFLKPIMPYHSWLSEMLLAVGYGLCIMAILFGPRGLQRPFSWMPLRWIGLISYSLYIWHVPLLGLLQSRILPFFGLANTAAYSPQFYLAYVLTWLWALLVICPFCLLCYICVEKPGIKLGDRWRKALDARYRAREAARIKVAAAGEGMAAMPAKEEEVALVKGGVEKSAGCATQPGGTSIGIPG